MVLSRRQFIKTSAIASTLTTLPSLLMAMSAGPDYHYDLIAEEATISLLPNTKTAAWTFNQQFPAPVIRAKQGQKLTIRFTNKLQEPTTIHWHGLRIPIAMDGVPFLSQPPIMPGQTFTYEFTPPDAGTFWYHPHMNSVKQLGKGLVGVLIVEEADKPDFDHDVVIGLKDWRLADDGSFLPLSIPRYAARGGTLGNVKTVEGQLKPVFEIPAGGRIRARFANMDNTRTYNLSIKDFDATVIAEDGNAVATPYTLTTRKTGVGMRLDIGFIAPKDVDEEVIVYDKKGNFYFEIFRFKTVPSNTGNQHTAIPVLPINPIAKVNLEHAEKLSFVFEWAGALSPTKKDGTVKQEFWTINKRAWEGMSANNLPEPLANLQLGKPYLITLTNNTPHHHPIHLHGHTFTVLKSTKRDITPYHTDTILLAKNERAQIAFVADNPGKWMFHCHVIEHMKTGLMGFIEVA